MNEAVTAAGKENYEIGLNFFKEGKYKEALKHYQLSADEGYAPAQFQLGQLIYKASIHDEAFRYFKLSADQKNAGAQFMLGELYEHGRGVNQDCKAAREYYELSAHQGNQKAQLYLANVYADGLLGVQMDLDKAEKYLRLSADQNNESAHYALGLMYQAFAHQVEDYHKALNYFMQALKHYKLSALCPSCSQSTFEMIQLRLNEIMMIANCNYANHQDDVLIKFIAKTKLEIVIIEEEKYPKDAKECQAAKLFLQYINGEVNKDAFFEENFEENIKYLKSKDRELGQIIASFPEKDTAFLNWGEQIYLKASGVVSSFSRFMSDVADSLFKDEKKVETAHNYLNNNL